MYSAGGLWVCFNTAGYEYERVLCLSELRRPRSFTWQLAPALAVAVIWRIVPCAAMILVLSIKHLNIFRMLWLYNCEFQQCKQIFLRVTSPTYIGCNENTDVQFCQAWMEIPSSAKPSPATARDHESQEPLSHYWTLHITRPTTRLPLFLLSSQLYQVELNPFQSIPFDSVLRVLQALIRKCMYICTCIFSATSNTTAYLGKYVPGCSILG